MLDDIESYWEGFGEVLHRMPLAAVERAAEVLLQCHGRGGTVFVLGNGGSAATASHFVCDLAKGTRSNGVPTFRVVSLTDNVPLMTAWANDTSYDRVFAEQLSALVRPGDCVLIISASGNSRNVVLAAQVGREAGAKVIGLTGQTGGKLLQIADLMIKIPAPTIELVEDAHLVVGHSLCVALRKQLLKEATTRLPEEVFS